MIVQEIKRLNLYTPYLLWYMFPNFNDKTSHDEEKLEKFILKNYNGIGASWIPSPIRSLITKHYQRFELAAKIHDTDYTILPKTEEYFHQANKRFLDNCLILARDSWYYKLQAKFLFKMVELAGWKAFIGS